MSEFKREVRYTVIKHKHLFPGQKSALEKVIVEHRIPCLTSLVIEPDWPEYEPAWQMIERRMTRLPAQDFDRVTAERDGLQISLNTADQSIDELNAAISRRTHRVRELQALLTAADERAVALEGLLQGWLDLFPKQGVTVGPLTKQKERTVAALKPVDPKSCCTVTPEEQSLLDSGDYTPEELFGVGGKPSCRKCAKP